MLCLNPQFRWNAVAKEVMQELLHESRDSRQFFDKDLDNAALQLLSGPSPSGLRVLADESGDNLDDLFLLPARKLRHLFKNLMHFAVGPVLRARLIGTSSPSNSATDRPRIRAAWRTNSTDGLLARRS